MDTHLAKLKNRDLAYMRRLANQILNYSINSRELLSNNLIKAKSYGKPIRILVISTQFPTFGGAATNAYYLIKFLRESNISCGGLFFHNKISANFDPDQIGGIWRLKLLTNDYYNKNAETVNQYVNEIEEYLSGCPDLILGLNYLAPLYGKMIYPSVKTLYCTTGSQLITKMSEKRISLKKYIDDIPLIPDHQFLPEMECINAVDGVLFNSELIRNVFQKIYFNYQDKFIDQSVIMTDVCVNQHYTNPEEKIYDVIIVVSSCDRTVKNINLSKKIIENLKCKALVIGKKSDEYFGDLKNVDTLPLQDQKTVYEYFSKSKLLLLPSFIESSGIVINEALSNDCLVLTSQNVGLSYRLSNIFLCKDVYDEGEWIKKAEHILKNHQILINTVQNDCDPAKILTFIQRYIENPIEKTIDTKSKRILIMSIDTPYVGGSGANTYKMIKTFREKTEHCVAGLFIDKDETNVTDPDKIGGISRITKFDKDQIPIIRSQIKKHLGGKSPEIVIAKNYISVYLARKIFSSRSKVIFSPSGSRYYSWKCGVDKFMTYNEFYRAVDAIETEDECDLEDFCYSNNRSCGENCKCEYAAFKYADVILPNSRISRELFMKCYPMFVSKIYHYIPITNVDYVKKDSKPFSERKYDVVFCSYSWKRKVKNADLMLKIIGDERLKAFNILVIGKNINDKQLPPNAQYIPNCGNNVIMDLMGDSKVYVMPSYYDSNPNTIVEASMMGLQCCDKHKCWSK